MNKTAVVFDSAGTLVDMYRVARDMASNTFISDSDNLKIVSEMTRSSLVVLDTPADAVLDQDPDRFLSEYLSSEKIPLGIAFSREAVDHGDVLAALEQSGIRLDSLQKTIRKAGSRFRDAVYSVCGFIADAECRTIPYLMSTGGVLFENAEKVVDDVRKTGSDIYIASGDDRANVFRVADRLRIPRRNVYPLCRSEQKEKIVSDLQKIYDQVFMIGDGLNDRPALLRSDFGILICRENYYTPDYLKTAADIIVSDLGDCPDIIRARILDAPSFSRTGR